MFYRNRVSSGRQPIYPFNKLIMFQGEFVLAAGMDYRFLDASLNNPPLMHSFHEEQTQQLHQALKTIEILEGKLASIDEYVQSLEHDNAYFKKRVRELDVDVSVEQKAPCTIIENQKDQDSDSMQQEFNRFQTLRNGTTPEDGLQRVLDLQASNLFGNTQNIDQQSFRSIRGLNPFSYEKLKTLVKIVCNNMTTMIKMMARVRVKATSDNLDQMKRSVPVFIEAFNRDYRENRMGQLSDDYYRKTVSILKEFSQQLDYIYNNTFKRNKNPVFRHETKDSLVATVKRK